MSANEMTSIAHDTGLLYGRLRFRDSMNPFYSYDQSVRDAYHKGYAAGQKMTKLEQGESFTVTSVTGESCLCVKDDLEVGDPVVVLSRHGVLTQGFEQPAIVKSQIHKINGTRAITESPLGGDDRITLKDLPGGSYHQQCVFRLVG